MIRLIKLSVYTLPILALQGCSTPQPDNPNLVDSDVAGGVLPRVELNRCDPSTEVGPTIRRGRLPKYPVAEFFNDKPGEVVLRFDVTETGDTDNIEVIRSTSKPFITTAGDAVEDWKFRPALDNGSPTRVTCTQRYVFDVENR